MVSILAYILLGIIIYVAGIPILEELATVIVQGLEVIKGHFVLILSKMEKQKKSLETQSQTRLIGFTVPDDEEEDDDYDE